LRNRRQVYYDVHMAKKAKLDKRVNNGGARRGSGRPKGSLNKTPPAVREYAKSFTNESIDRLVDLMRHSENEEVVLAAIELLCNRAHGKPGRS
jgi:hypothetical protein